MLCSLKIYTFVSLEFRFIKIRAQSFGVNYKLTYKINNKYSEPSQPVFTRSKSMMKMQE